MENSWIVQVPRRLLGMAFDQFLVADKLVIRLGLCSLQRVSGLARAARPRSFATRITPLALRETRCQFTVLMPYGDEYLLIRVGVQKKPDVHFPGTLLECGVHAHAVRAVSVVGQPIGHKRQWFGDPFPRSVEGAGVVAGMLRHPCGRDGACAPAFSAQRNVYGHRGYRVLSSAWS